MEKQPLPLSQVYRLIEPGPVVLVSTSKQSKTNIMAMSWHMMVEFEPPILACIISANNYTFDILKETGECVINIPTVELAEKVVSCGNTSGLRIDKFKTFALTPSPAEHVHAPLIDDCYANLECRVIDTTMSTKYNMFMLKVVKAWIDPSIKQPQTIHHRGEGTFMVAGGIIQLLSAMK